MGGFYMKQYFEEIVKCFKFSGEFVGAYRYGSGHINDTYLCCFDFENGDKKRYIIQRINHNVFRQPEELMTNIEGITKHLKKKIVLAGGNPERETLNIIPAKDGKSYHKTEDDQYWRVYLFIENAHTYDIVENFNHFYNAGRAFGMFQKHLSDFPAKKLHETIPNFHNTKKRYEDFIKAVEKDPFNRAGDVKKEIEFAIKHEGETSVLTDLLKSGKLPLRVTHNDTKFNNVMIDDKTGEGICVIDLDTVMSGSSLYDYGDSIRFGTNPAAEDEKDLSKVWMELNLFEYYTHGFLDAARDFLKPIEYEYMPFSAKLMTYECGIRFLADYINGDIYFKVHHDAQNVDRTRTQFKLVTEMEQKEDEMRKIIEKYRY
jgi:Ser/Thr protein kinase RdoA (MazF antagonist)